MTNEMEFKIYQVRTAYEKAVEQRREQQEAIRRWKRAGVDPEVNTDYVSSSGLWEREYDDLEKLEEKERQVKALLDDLLRQQTSEDSK
jgi:hypothetical protein